MDTDIPTIDLLADLTDTDAARIARITEAFLALSPAGREAVLLWILPQHLNE